MNGRASLIGTGLAIVVSLSLLVGMLVMILGHSSAHVDDARIAERATALSDAIILTADAGHDQNVSVGEKVRFDASHSLYSGGSIDNYTWSFNYDGGEMKLYGAEPSFTFEKTGEYPVTLNVTVNVTDGPSLYDTDQVFIKVSAEKVSVTSLIYSGGAAAAVAALLIVVFIVMRSSKGNGRREEPGDDSEEEFEEA